MSEIASLRTLRNRNAQLNDMLSNPLLEPYYLHYSIQLKAIPASQLNGLSASGSASNAIIARQALYYELLSVIVVPEGSKQGTILFSKYLNKFLQYVE